MCIRDRYWFTIGLSGVFSLTGWSRQIHAEFLVLSATQATTMLRQHTNTQLSCSCLLYTSPNCGEWHVYHTVGGACGYYRGKLAIEKEAAV